MTTTPTTARRETWTGDEAVRTLTFHDFNPPGEDREPIHVTARVLVNDRWPIRVTDGWALSGTMADGTVATVTVHPDDVDLSEYDPPHGLTVRLAGLRCLLPKGVHPVRILLGEPTATPNTPDNPAAEQVTEWVRISLFVAVAIVR